MHKEFGYKIPDVCETVGRFTAEGNEEPRGKLGAFL